MGTKILPAFPAFTAVDLGSREGIVSLTREFPGYSDFNFVNLLSWNLRNGSYASILNNNLVFKLTDYITDECFLTFIGNTKLAQTSKELLHYANMKGYAQRLRLVPEHIAMSVAEDAHLSIAEDIDNHDYVVSLSSLASLAGGRQRHTRRQVKKFADLHESYTEYKELVYSDRKIQEAVYNIFHDREELKENNSDNEFVALQRLVEHAHELPVFARGLFVAGELKAFIFYELDESRKEGVGHFWKADSNFDGIYYYLLHRLAKELYSNGYELMNIEQDLGIPGLRLAKQLLRPVSYYKKFTILMRRTRHTEKAGTPGERVVEESLLTAHLSDLGPHAKGPEPVGC